MGMSDEQFEVYNALLNFLDELIDRETDESEKKMESLVRYPLREGRGQELNNRRPDKKRKVVL